MNQFEIAMGTVAGRDHFRASRNNQDAFRCLVTEDTIVAVVCDGCSSSPHSEVGAKIGASLMVQTILRHCRRLWDTSLTLERTRQDVLAQLRILANSMGESLSRTIGEYLLFTVIGAIITPENCTVFSLGDGLFIYNEHLKTIGPFPENEPPYLAYALLEPELTKFSLEQLRFQLDLVIPSKQLESLLIGTDGVNDLIEVTERNLPGKEEKVGPISQFWQDDPYFQNPDMVRRRLTLINREVFRVSEEGTKKQTGLLPDDTTLIVIRRKKKVGGE